MFRIFSVNVFFITLQRKSFGQNFFLNFMHEFKSAILPELKIDKMAILNPCMEFKKKFGQRTSFEAFNEDDIYKKYL